MALMEAFVPWANSQSWIERYFWNQAVSLVPWKLTICVMLLLEPGNRLCVLKVEHLCDATGGTRQ